MSYTPGFYTCDLCGTNIDVYHFEGQKQDNPDERTSFGLPVPIQRIDVCMKKECWDSVFTTFADKTMRTTV